VSDVDLVGSGIFAGSGSAIRAPDPDSAWIQKKILHSKLNFHLIEMVPVVKAEIFTIYIIKYPIT